MNFVFKIQGLVVKQYKADGGWWRVCHGKSNVQLWKFQSLEKAKFAALNLAKLTNWDRPYSQLPKSEKFRKKGMDIISLAHKFRSDSFNI